MDKSEEAMQQVAENGKLNKDMPILSMKKLSKNYLLGEVEVHALREINLAIQEGEYIAIMGPSGSGKSTLLNMIGCLDHPSSGSYYLGGEDVSLLDDNRLSLIRGERIGFIFQSFNLINQLNVVENIEVSMYYQGIAERASFKRAKELAELVGLGERLHHRPFELSGGQQQRVAIARALANDPLIILADEPTGNLDSESGTDILVILDRLHKEGKTLISVTHDERIASHAERVIHLFDGKISKQEDQRV